MKIRIREQSGTDAGRKFDYQMAVAIDYILSEFDNDAIVLIETLEDFAVFRNFCTEFEKVDIYQVKTKNSGLYCKSSLWDDNVIGKIILTDFYFDSKANSLNIICNTHLKGASTESLECFHFEDSLTTNELAILKENVTKYLKTEPSFNDDVSKYFGKLIYIKSALPFSEKQDRYSETLIGKTNNIIVKHLGEEYPTINPQIVFDTLKMLVDRQRRYRFKSQIVDINEAINQKGINSNKVKYIIDELASRSNLSKTKIFEYASQYFSPKEFLSIKEEYPIYLTYKDNLSDKAFLDAKDIITKVHKELTFSYDFMEDLVPNVAINSAKQIAYYSLPVIQIITITVIFS